MVAEAPTNFQTPRQSKMQNRRSPSVREIAKAIGLSKATVANALSGSRTVAASTVEKVRAAAASMGYTRNPLVGAFMSAMRRSRGSAFQGVIAVAEVTEPDRPRHGPFHQELVEGCKACAAELGFKTEVYQLSPSGLDPERLSSILKARGIRGLVLLPAWRSPEFHRFDWSAFTGVYTDYVTEKPVLNSICCDHYRSMFELLQQLSARDYRRPGLILDTGRDERVHLRTRAALSTFRAPRASRKPIEPLFTAEINPTTLARWLKHERPDVVLSHNSDVLQWIKDLGLRVPEQIGFVALNRSKARLPCAALDLHADQIGRCSVEILIGQIQRQAWGLPHHPTTTTIIAQFVDGCTLRAQRGASTD